MSEKRLDDSIHRSAADKSIVQSSVLAVQNAADSM